MATNMMATRRTHEGGEAGKGTARRVRIRNCHHHWVIAPPNGPVSTGHCKICGRERKFPNSSEDSIWDGAEGRSRWNDMGISRRRRAGDEPIAEENVVTV